MNHLENKVYFIISACKGLNPREDAVYTDELRSVLESRNETFKQVSGRYKGKEEESFMVQAPAHIQGTYESRELTKAALMELASVFGQECIAELDVNNDLMYLHYLAEGKPSECLGKVVTNNHEPLTDYTKVGDKYLTVAPIH